MTSQNYIIFVHTKCVTEERGRDNRTSMILIGLTSERNRATSFHSLEELIYMVIRHGDDGEPFVYGMWPGDNIHPAEHCTEDTKHVRCSRPFDFIQTDGKLTLLLSPQGTESKS